jgi:hypothetical protein
MNCHLFFGYHRTSDQKIRGGKIKMGAAALILEIVSDSHDVTEVTIRSISTFISSKR